MTVVTMQVFHFALCIFAGKLRFLHERHHQSESSATRAIVF